MARLAGKWAAATAWQMMMIFFLPTAITSRGAKRAQIDRDRFPQGDAHGDYSEFQRPSVVRKAARQVFLVQTELLDKIAELVG